MSNAASNYLENATLDFWLNGNSGSHTSPGTLYLGLFHGTASGVLANLEAGTMSDEVTLGSYARQTASFGSASSGSISNDQAVTFPTATGNYDDTVTCIAILDASTSGNVLWYGQLSVSKTVTTGDQFQVATGNLQVSLT
jgi:hypothetical protein|tara:strand:- start:1090 stop:1509 length:420 start_codon:yes stop_codon:yes gene_type:complete